MTPADLIAFEDDIAACFARGEIASPIHLSGGNEEQLIELFRDIQPWDWVLCSWRAHYHCLLKGVPADELKAAILAGKSIALTFPKQKILCSAIVGGTAPIAVGLGMALKTANAYAINHDTRVHCFIGDMTAETGIVHECMKYAAGHSLPVRWIIEDNGLSVNTDTRRTWNEHSGGSIPSMIRYPHKLGRPHSGIGQYVHF